MINYQEIELPPKYAEIGLKPCPFCGSNLVFAYSGGEVACNGVPIPTTYIQCSVCGGRTSYHEGIASAVSCWNERP